MESYIVRHAESARNVGAHPDDNAPLTANGVEQARRLGAYFSECAIDRVYSSPLTRAKDTLKDIRPYISDSPITFAQQLKEHNMGVYGKNGVDDWKGYARDAMESGQEFQLFRPQHGESLQEAYNRAGSFFDKLVKEHPNDKVLINGHGMLSLYMLLHALGRPVTDGRYLRLNNASVSVLKTDEKGKVLNYQVNDCNHLLVPCDNDVYRSDTNGVRQIV